VRRESSSEGRHLAPSLTHLLRVAWSSVPGLRWWMQTGRRQGPEQYLHGTPGRTRSPIGCAHCPGLSAIYGMSPDKQREQNLLRAGCRRVTSGVEAAVTGTAAGQCATDGSTGTGRRPVIAGCDVGCTGSGSWPLRRRGQGEGGDFAGVGYVVGAEDADEQSVIDDDCQAAAGDGRCDVGEGCGHVDHGDQAGG